MSLIEKFKALFNEQEATEQKFADFKLADGTIIRTEELVEGNVVEIMDEAGELTLAPAGEHELEDGRIITLDENSVIVAIAEPAAEEEAPAEDAAEPAEQEMAEVDAPEAEVEAPVAEAETPEAETESVDYDAKIAELEDTIVMIMDKLKEMEGLKSENAELEVAMNALKTENKALKDTVPATESAKFKKIDPTKVDSNKTPVKKGSFSDLVREYRGN